MKGAPGFGAHGRMASTASYSDTCRKFVFVSKADARDSARQMRKRGVHVRPYQCTRCGLYHTGTLPKGVMAGTMSAQEIVNR